MMDLSLGNLVGLAYCVGAAVFINCGVRFRRWVVDDRPGIPRFSSHVETVLLWLIYSTAVSAGIVVIKQTLRHF